MDPPFFKHSVFGSWLNVLLFRQHKVVGPRSSSPVTGLAGLPCALKQGELGARHASTQRHFRVDIETLSPYYSFFHNRVG